MPVKDYYKILELPPGASLKEVKKNFRRLALRYHPDKNQGNKHAEAWYREIKEAYETLVDPVLKEAYLQQRWLAKNEGKAFSETLPLTPELILKQANELFQQVKNIDHFRMDHTALQQQLLLAIDDERTDVLNSYNEQSINLQVIQIILDCLFPLEFRLIIPVIKQLKKITHPANTIVDRYYEKRSKLWYWEKYQGLVIFVATLVLCVLIYLASN